MTEEVQKIRQTTTRAGDTVQKTTEVSDPNADADQAQTIAVRVVWYIAGILSTLLGFRFLLSLLGANTSNQFANFIYNASHPFVAPFFNLFRYSIVDYGVSRFEVYTLVAILVYSVIAWGIVGLLTLNSD